MRRKQTLVGQLQLGLVLLALVVAFNAVLWLVERYPDAWPWLTRLLAE